MLWLYLRILHDRLLPNPYAFTLHDHLTISFDIMYKLQSETALITDLRIIELTFAGHCDSKTNQLFFIKLPFQISGLYAAQGIQPSLPIAHDTVSVH
jgi:hypothetical protein